MNQNNDINESAIKRIKQKNALQKQKRVIIITAAAILLLAVLLAVVLYLVNIYVYEDFDGTKYYVKKIDDSYVLCYENGEVCDKNTEGYYQTDVGTLLKVDGKSGWKIYARVDTEGTEELAYLPDDLHVLIFKQMTYDMSATTDMSKVIKSIEINNEYGNYKFVRANDKSNDFMIEGYEDASLDRQTFAQLAVACGYTLSMRRLEDPKLLENGEIDYAEYGLANKVEYVSDGWSDCGTPSIVETEPINYTVTAMNGDIHKVYLGDMTVTGTGYYARYEGRDTVYVLSSTNISATVVKSAEELVVPMIVYPMGMTDYFNVANFTIYDNIDYDAIKEELAQRWAGATDEELDSEEFAKDYSESFEKNSHKACDFTYVDADSRKNSMYATIPYVSNLEYTAGYYVNSSNIDKVLYAMYDPEFTAVEKLLPDDEDIKKYGLEFPEYVIAYLYLTKTDAGEDAYVYNYLEVSEKTEDGVYYVYSSMYDMIVGVSESSFDFLEWEEIDWYDTSYIQLDIGHVTDIIIESPEFSTHFTIDDSASKYMTYFEQSGKSFSDGVNKYEIKKDAMSGRYALTLDGKPLAATYAGDYLITPLAYSQGEAQSDKFLFVETKSMDIDGDGNADANAYYYYNVVYRDGQYCLAIQIALADSSGQKLAEDQAMLANPYYTTDFYITNSSYIYLTDKDSYLGVEINKKYGAYNRGRWGSGNLYMSADNKTILVNSSTGEWSILDDASCGFYAADSVKSRLAQRAVEIPAKYDSAGKLTRYPETYYPTTEERMQYNEETGAIEVYNYKQKLWESAAYSDCTIGIWCNGAYFVTEGGAVIAVNGLTGEWGIVSVATNENYIAEILADEVLLDYNIKTTNHVGTVTVSNATDNFKQFYKGMLYASLEGMADLTDDEKEALAALDGFTDDSAANPCQLKITIYAQDIYGNRRDVIYRFYQYTERKSFITIESLSSPKDESDSTRAYGSFYVIRSFADKIIEDAKKIVNEEEVVAITKY